MRRRSGQGRVARIFAHLITDYPNRDMNKDRQMSVFVDPADRESYIPLGDVTQERLSPRVIRFTFHGPDARLLQREVHAGGWHGCRIYDGYRSERVCWPGHEVCHELEREARA